MTDKKKYTCAKNEIGNSEAWAPKLAHEIRARLGIIRGSLENVTEGICGPVSDSQKRQLNLAVDSVERMTCLVEDLLASFSYGSGGLKINAIETPLAELIVAVMDGMGSEAFKEGVSLITDFEDDALLVKCDPLKIEQVLINLLKNAIKFTSRGGCVSIDVETQSESVEISVTDSGVGIPAERLEELRQAPDDIQQLRDADGGFRSSGLGLIIVNEIIEAHGSELKIESEIGKGSIFTFILPLA